MDIATIAASPINSSLGLCVIPEPAPFARISWRGSDGLEACPRLHGFRGCVLQRNLNRMAAEKAAIAAASKFQVGDRVRICASGRHIANGAEGEVQGLRRGFGSSIECEVLVPTTDGRGLRFNERCENLFLVARGAK